MYYLMLIDLHNKVFIQKVGYIAVVKLMVESSIHGSCLCRRNGNVSC
jgi:hypothetical protein